MWFNRLNKRQQKILKRVGIALGIVFMSLLIIFFIFRNSLLNSIVSEKVNSFNKKFHAELKIGEMSFDGITGVVLKNITLKPQQGDSLFRTSMIKGSISFWKILIGTIDVSNFEIENTYLSLNKSDSTDNFMFLLSRKKDKKDDSTSVTSYAKRFDALADAIFAKIPQTMNVKNLNVSFNKNGHLVTMHLNELNVIDHTFNSVMEIREDSVVSQLGIKGNIYKGDRRGRFVLYSPNKSTFNMPYLKHKWEMQLGFDSVLVDLSDITYEDNVLTATGSAGVKGLVINHWRIANQPVVFNKSQIDFKINIGKDYFEVDSATLVSMNQLTFNPYLRYRPRPSKQLTLRINKEPFLAQDLFDSFPQGLFENFVGIKTSGLISYKFDFFMDMANLDSLRFSSELKPSNFKIVNYGKTDFRYINNEFRYTAYDKDVAIRSFDVGPSNSAFRPLDQISEYLKSCVLTSEDGAFFYHRGFYEEAFRRAIVTDIKQHRFAKGGSTISMQLVKNAFLNRNKTVVRKLEEALIVWLIESNHLVSKNRMYEVYLNLIEWGPRIYGAGEAAQFYFNKDVSQLTLSEAIYLASIVPHPKTFMYSFNTDGNLKDHMTSYYDLLLRKLIQKSLITPEDTTGIIKNVILTGPAKELLRKPDTTEVFEEVLDEEMPVIAE